MGKTTFAAKCRGKGRVLLLATERGYQFIDEVDVLDVDKWATFTKAVEVIDFSPYDTVAIDTAMGLADLIQESVCKDAGIKHPSDAGDRKTGAIYDQIGLQFGVWAARLEQKARNMVWIAPERPVTIRTGVVRTVADVPTTTLRQLEYRCDFIGHAEERDGKRVLAFSGKDLLAGQRWTAFPDGWCPLDGGLFFETVTKKETN
jgi:hypothetical protein